MSRRAAKALAGAAGVVALAITTLIQPWEGRSLTAYRDIVNVWTICDGETKGVKPGMVKTNAERDAMLLKRVENDFYRPLTKCIANYTGLPVSLQASLLSASYNVGVGAICNSTAARLARAEQYILGALFWSDNRGYQRAAMEYTLKIERIHAEYKDAAEKEAERQAAANSAAKQREAARIAQHQR